ncbi:transposase [Streptococcus pneumoniae]|uniref:transposase n=1 Tax=Streptococcus pneumoniae TaxID=1313 RepID=UPI0038CD23D2
MKSLGINFYLLPPYSPEYNPIEKTWAHIKKPRKRYYQVAIPFMRLFCLVLVSIDYIISVIV